jgi:outer membrane biogenesis lipoprotein LolB
MVTKKISLVFTFAAFLLLTSCASSRNLAHVESEESKAAQEADRRNWQERYTQFYRQ